MGRKHDEIWQELRELDNRVTRLEDRAILKPECDPADVAFNRAQPWEWQVPTARPAAPVDGLAELRAENAVLTHNIRETMGLVKSFRIERDELQAENARLVAERDALCARIEAGVVVWGSYQSGGLCFAGEGARDETDTHTAILIDATPINHIADAGDVDERKGAADRKAGSNE